MIRGRVCVLILAGVVAAGGGGTASGRGLADDLNNFVDDLGGGAMGNVTGASVYRGQSRTYLNGGRVFIRNPARVIHPVSVQLPSVKAGCGGIDIFTGSMSFVDSDELVQALESIGNGMAGYMFLIGLRAISPQLATTLETMQDWAQKLNNMNINTCKMAAWATNALVSQSIPSMEDSACVMRKMQSSNMAYDEAVKDCAPGDARENALQNEETKETAGFIDGNLAWMAMQENGMFDDDAEMREIFQSITGTKIKNTDIIPTDVKTYPSKLYGDDDFLKALLEGGTVSTYKCGNSSNLKYGCKEIQTGSVTIDENESLYAMARTALHNVYARIRDKGDPSENDLAFVKLSSVPLSKVLSIGAAFGGEAGLSLVDRYAEVAAVDLLFAYVNRILDTMEGQSQRPEFGADGEEFRKGLQGVREIIRRKRAEVEETLRRTVYVAEEFQAYERLLVSTMPRSLEQGYLFGR